MSCTKHSPFQFPYNQFSMQMRLTRDLNIMQPNGFSTCSHRTVNECLLVIDRNFVMCETVIQ